MKRPAFDEIFMELAATLAQRSHCVKKQVGAVLVKDTRIISTGYNGPPAGTYNCREDWPGVGCARDAKGSCSFAIHAEHNAITYAINNQTNVKGATLYITLSPCLPCARIIFGAGISKVVYAESYATYKGLSQEEGILFLKEFGVEVTQYKATDL